MADRGYAVGKLDGSKVWELHALYGQRTFSASQILNASWPTILVKSDWASVCRSVDGYEESEFQLPFDDCLFETSIGGFRSAAVFKRADEDGDTYCMTFVHVGGVWAPYTIFYLIDGVWRRSDSYDVGAEGFIQTIVDQVRASSILVEAEVVELIKHLPDTKLQKARAKRGKPPLMAHLEIGMRRQQKPSIDSGEYQGVRRCHFRRGHWMRVGDKRVWRKWTIVGNPDLGFVDKTYVVGGAA